MARAGRWKAGSGRWGGLGRCRAEAADGSRGGSRCGWPMVVGPRGKEGEEGRAEGKERGNGFLAFFP
jgi:hypothetical protein